MSIVRQCLCVSLPRSPLRIPLCLTSPSRLLLLNSTIRTYASKSKNRDQADSSSSKRGPVATDFLVPGSQQTLSNPAAQAEHERASAKMSAAVEWFRRETSQMEARASGRVTPQLLSPVRVSLPGGEGEGVRLEEVATVGVRDGSMLIVTVFDAEVNAGSLATTLKHVESAIYEAKLPHIVPQRADERTIKIPIPKPTVESRLALYNSAARQAEEMRTQVRKHHQASMKKGKYTKHSVELQEFQKLLDRNIGEIDTILAQLKKSTGAR
ncbi:hypothetical protein EW146_g6909 [Bondarzewia mesenterica]|uniref:Ribosome recycling factor domain-containing protein n=1 Tax=Bondarzewia mesenterica TaxID=1095465 RepID=A0A4S4LP41_9AGAM|nr:hypothetical protein EW146_g6909 [Bondarzewia mesenterica]